MGSPLQPRAKMQCKQWIHHGSTPPKKYKRVHSAGKVMASIFWDSQGDIMIDYLKQGRTTNGAYYIANWDGYDRKSQERGEEN